MVKVQLPKVEEETRAELNIIKARRKDKSLDETLNYLLYHDKISQNMSMSSLERLGKLTRANETWDDLINRILDERDEANRKIRELESDLINIKLGRSTLSEFKEDIKGLEDKNVKCTIRLKDSGITKYDEELK
jgi:hypothetical protein